MKNRVLECLIETSKDLVTSTAVHGVKIRKISGAITNVRHTLFRLCEDCITMTEVSKISTYFGNDTLVKYHLLNSHSLCSDETL